MLGRDHYRGRPSDPTVTVSGTVVGLNVRDFGAVGDGTTDDSSAFAAAIAAVNDAQPLGNSRNRIMRTIYVPEPDVSYRFGSEVTIPSTKQVYFVGEGSNGSRITCDVDYAFYVEAGSSFRARGFEKMLFDGCGVRVEDQSRNQHVFDKCFFKDTNDYAIKLQAAGETLGASGGVVGGQITNCEFENCAGAILCQGDQSDNWVVYRCQFTRSSAADIKVYSAGWHIHDCAFEQRWDANLDEPFINVGGTNVSDLIIRDNRFGNEVGGLGTQPPREAIVLGALGASEAGHLLDIRILGNYFRGRAGTGPTANSANVAIRLNKGVSYCQIKGNYFFKYNSSLIQFAHANNNDGEANILELVNGNASSSGNTNHNTLFNSRPSHGQLGSWTIRGWLPEQEGTNRLVFDVQTVDDSPKWNKSGVSVAKDVTSYDGRTNAAYTVTKTTSGTTGSLYTSLDSLNGQPLVCSARFRKATGSSINTGRFYAQNTSQAKFSSSTASTFELKPYWERQWFVMWPDSGDNVTLWIGADELSSPEIGDLELDDIRVEYGTCPSTGGPNLVQYGSDAPSSGEYLVGDLVWNTAPAAAGNIGWVCTASGSPGTWKTWGTIEA